MKKLYLYISGFLSLLILVGFSPLAMGQSQFFESLYDVPIMTGLVEDPSMALNFDKPDGRIAEAGAIATGYENQEIMSFYQQSLPQLGWRQVGQNVFARKVERLEIFIGSVEGVKIVRFSLSPL